MTKPLALALAFLACACPAFAQFDLTARTSREQRVQLEPSSGKPVEVTPTEIKKTKEVTIPFNVKRTGYFELPTTIPLADPIRINFGTRNPEKGWGLRLARLAPKEGKVEVTMKMGVTSMNTTKEYRPYVEDLKVPEAVKGADGQFVLTLPRALAPGIYAIVGFNGASGPGGLFSTRDGFAWVFEVPLPQTAIPAAPTEPVAAVPAQSPMPPAPTPVPAPASVASPAAAPASTPTPAKPNP